ncbi:MAG: tetratricopeptide repeat protein [Myxococcales bacterium]|nr:tetratricopeptide repeat protein [Myxococcales bacterium]
MAKLLLADGEVDLEVGTVRRAGGQSTLSTGQLRLLRYLADRRGQDVDRDELLVHVWGYSRPPREKRAVDNAVRRLRQEIEPDPTSPTLLLTVHGQGYRLAATEQDSSSHPAPSFERPQPIGGFVGRDEALGTLEGKLASASCLVLTGPGGVGKTRLALEAAHGWQGGPVVFCDLTPARDARGVTLAAAGALGVSADADLADRTSRVFGTLGRCLVICDGCEHVAPEVAEAARRWMTKAPDATFLITSRRRPQALHAAVQTLAPLSPEAAAQLFSLRAAERLDLHDVGSPKLDELMALLDRLPLAIELAAARLSVMSVDAMVDRIGQRFQLLRDPMRATLDFSWSLLEASEQQALSQLSVFVGSFSLDAAEQVVHVEGSWPADLLDALVAHSLMQRLPDDRFALLHTVRAYAEELLHTPEPVLDRHARTFAALGTEPALELLHRHEGPARRHALARALPDLVAACRHAATRGPPEVAVATLCAAWAVTSIQGPLALAAELADGVAQLPTVDGAERLRLERTLGEIARRQGDHAAARRHFEIAHTVADDLGDATQRALCDWDLALVHHILGDSEASEARYRASSEALDALGERLHLGRVLGSHGAALYTSGRTSEAERTLELARAIHRAVGNLRFEGLANATLGALYVQGGRHEQARQALTRAIHCADRTGASRSVGIARGNLGMMHENLGEWTEARAAYAEALRIARNTGDAVAEAAWTGNLGRLAWAMDQVQEARDTLERATELARQVDNPRIRAVHWGALGVTYLGTGDTDEAERCLSTSLSLCRAAATLRHEASQLVELAHLRWMQDRHDEAVQILASALELAERVEVRQVQLRGRLLRARMKLADQENTDAATDLDHVIAATEDVPGSELRPRAMAHRALVCARQDRPDQAAECLRRAQLALSALHRSETKVHTWVAATRALARLGRADEAEATLLRAEQAAPDHRMDLQAAIREARADLTRGC